MADVFVIDRAALFGGQWPHGFVPVAPAEAPDFLRAARAGRFEPRPTAESTPAWKQWIPYCVIRCFDPARPDRSPTGRPTGVFHVQRTSGQTEARLHGSRSIGLGGHIDPEDVAGAAADHPESFFLNALWRELGEELWLPDSARACDPRFVGLLNDDTTPVGAVHAGLVYVLDLPLPLAAAVESVQVREISKMRGGFGPLVELARLWQTPSQFETWSAFLLRDGVAGPMGDSAERTV